MINKNIFLKSVGCSAGKFAKEANDLIYNWHNLYNFDIKLNQIDERLIRTLTIAINFWKHLVSFETEGFRDSIGRLSFHKLLKEIIENDKEINYFGILCPSYKKGIRAIGFSDEPGNTTYRAFDNLKIMAENTNLLGIKCNVRMFYADISFENYKKLSKQDKKDIEKNIWLDSIIAKAHNIPFCTLTEFAPELKQIVGPEGRIVNIKELNVSEKAFDRSVWRDRQFYPKNFGWTKEEADERTTVHAHSYYWQGEYIRKNLKYPVMIYSAYDYEKAGLYNGKDGSLWPCVVFPPKKEFNPPNATIPKIILKK